MSVNGPRLAAKEIASHFADELGYTQRSAGVFTSVTRHSVAWFFFQAGVNHGVGEFTPCVGVEIPSVDALVALAPGLERGVFPTLGGPLFRFADLSKRKLHDFVIKASTMDDVPGALRQLRAIWREVAQPFLAKHGAGPDWVLAADSFLADGRIGPFHIPIAGRTSVALVYAARGSDAARGAVQRLSVRGGLGKPFQDYEQARHLFDVLDDNPALLSELSQALT